MNNEQGMMNEEIRNPKSEIRNPKSGFVSNFDILYSDLTRYSIFDIHRVPACQQI